MKLKHGLLGCALATGLMIFAAENAQAGIVIDNVLYSPLNIKVMVGVYNDSNGKITKVSITSKEVLKMLGYKGNVTLAINTGAVESNDIYVISKDSVLENLTAEGILTADLNELLDYEDEGSNGQFKYNSSGILSLYFYSSPQFLVEVEQPLIVSNPNLDQAASEEASDYWFEISGQYAYTERGSAILGGKQDLHTGLKIVGNMSGTGHDVDLNSPYTTTVKGTATATGEGKVAIGG